MFQGEEAPNLSAHDRNENSITALPWRLNPGGSVSTFLPASRHSGLCQQPFASKKPLLKVQQDQNVRVQCWGGRGSEDISVCCRLAELRGAECSVGFGSTELSRGSEFSALRLFPFAWGLLQPWLTPGSPCRSLNVDMEWLYGASESSNMEVDIGYLPQVCASPTAPPLELLLWGLCCHSPELWNLCDPLIPQGFLLIISVQQENCHLAVSVPCSSAVFLFPSVWVES